MGTPRGMGGNRMRLMMSDAFGFFFDPERPKEALHLLPRRDRLLLIIGLPARLTR